jgi:glycerophosphoryl diester phosphodiesterase
MFLKVGHRGAKAYETENTLAGFQKAIELGADAIEFDVRRAKDGELVVIHDENLKRVFGHDVMVNRATVAELKQLTDGRIPGLGEALRFINGKVGKILTELKEGGYEREVLETINREGFRDRVIIVSFHEQALSAIRELDSAVVTGLIYSQHKNPIAAAISLNAQYLVPFYRFVHKKDVDKAHLNGLRVIVWTVNTKQEAIRFRAKGVDGIASDKPDILSTLLD